MAGYFKKRRGSQGPNKNEEKVQRAREAESAAHSGELLSAKFPMVKQLKIHLTFLERQAVLDEKVLSIGPNERAAFSVACPGRCGHGRFDFETKISETAQALLPSSESSAKCTEVLYADSPDVCGCEIRCRMELAYFPAPDTAPPTNG